MKLRMILRVFSPRLMLLGCVCLHGVDAHADWRRFRGPNGSGVSSDGKPVPIRWSQTENVKWKAELPGRGFSCPIVVGDRVFVTCYSGYGLDRRDPGDQKALKRHLVCIDRRSGAITWDQKVDAVLPEDPFVGMGVPEHGYASHTPVSDGDRVYVFFGKTGALAFDMDGTQLWQTGVGTESDQRGWGSASSPILYENLLIVTASPESEAVVALDTKTGTEVWRQEAAGFANLWGTPTFVEIDENRTDLVLGVPYEVWGLNPKNGKLRWYAEALQSGEMLSSLIGIDDVVVGVAGRGAGSIAVRAGGKGDVTASHVLWKGNDSARFGTPVAYRGRIYNVSGTVVTAIDVKTGKRLSQTRLAGRSGNASTPTDHGAAGGEVAAAGGSADLASTILRLSSRAASSTMSNGMGICSFLTSATNWNRLPSIA